MALTVVSPLVNIRLDALEDLTLDIRLSADEVAEEGENYAREAMSQIISERTGAYILDKAETLGLDITVEVTLSQEDYPVPLAVTIRGNVSPYAKTVLGDYISETLGIDTEEQTWIS